MARKSKNFSAPGNSFAFAASVFSSTSHRATTSPTLLPATLAAERAGAVWK
jgi:hypothetical protein